MRLIFMGTPDIAADSLNALISQGHKILAVFTREDKPVGRKQVLTPPPVKVVAVTHNIPVFQPKTLRDITIADTIREIKPDLIVVTAYGRILPKDILDIPRYGCINLHVSLLPKYRGAAPIQWAVINGDEMTGVSIQYMSEGVDEGDIISATPIAIGKNETSGELFERVSALGAKVLCECVDKIARGNIIAKPQDVKYLSFAPMLTKEMAQINFDMSCTRLHNLVRGLNPWPMARFDYEGQMIKLVRTICKEDISAPYGTIIAIKPLTIACTVGAVILDEVIPQGSRSMKGEEWAAGKRLVTGQII